MIISSKMDGVQALNFLRRIRRRELKRINKLRLRELRDQSDPFMATNEVFQGLYRLSKEVARELINILHPLVIQPQKSTGVSLELKVLCALHFYGHGSYQKSTGSDSNLGLSQPSVSRAIEVITEALNTPDLLAEWVKFPMTPNERRQIIFKNYEATRFPGVLGFVDGTHVAIRAPVENEFLYVNRKSYHSLNAQIVCDSSLRILNCVSRFPGSTHDSYIWNQSAVYMEMKELWERGERCWLLGDSGYPHQPWLQTPILHAQEGTPEAAYTAAHVHARNAVERCIGVLKSRFRCLLKNRVLEYMPEKAGMIVNACCVLHNMCIRGGLVMQEDEELDLHDIVPPPPPLQNPRAVLLEARVVRQSIIERLHQR